MTDQDVAATVLTVASNDPDLTDAAKFLIMAALESQQMLDEALQGDLTSSAVVPVDLTVKPEPVGAFLRSIRVQGFRGVGPQVTLTFQDGPGLTVIAGRNGSGKSTIAEALELALTGDTYRWARRSSVWKDSWRNMHQGVPCSIGVDIAVEGVGLTTVGVDWANGAEFDERTVWWQRKGEKRNPGLQNLGWDEPMRLFRPLLSYEELGGRLEAGPSELHDALEKISDLVRSPTPSIGWPRRRSRSQFPLPTPEHGWPS